MVLPLGDAPNPRGPSPVTWMLLAANVAVFLLITLPLATQPIDRMDPLLLDYLRMVTENARQPVSAREVLAGLSQYDLFVFRYGFRPADPALFDLLVSMFLHGGLMHLAGNMLFLWIYGDNVEHRLGPGAFLLAYLGTGVAATLSHAVFEPGSNVPMVGASGAISGVLGFYFLWFPRNRVRLLVVLFPFLVDVIVIPARLLLGFYLIADNLLPFLLTRGLGGTGVAYGAHIGGFIGGVAVAWWMGHHEPRGGARQGEGDPGAVREALAAGRMDEAARAYLALPPAATRRLLEPRESIALARWLEEHDAPAAALAVYRRHLRDFPRGPYRAEAELGAGRLQLEAFGEAPAAWQHFQAALDLDPEADVAAAARRGLEAIERGQSFRRWPGRRA